MDILEVGLREFLPVPQLFEVATDLSRRGRPAAVVCHLRHGDDEEKDLCCRGKLLKGDVGVLVMFHAASVSAGQLPAKELC